MVTIYNIKRNELKNGEAHLLVELRGLSTDEKPITLADGIVDNGSTFIEMDTQDIYFYDLGNKEWITPTSEDEQTDEVGE